MSHASCKKGFQWEGKPLGQETTIANNNAYVTGSNKDVAILIVHDIWGWMFPNLRLLADHYASECDATVYLPDFFGGENLIPILTNPEKAKDFDVGSFLGRNGKAVRGPEIFEVARALKQTHKKVGAIGFCYGGWAVAQLGAKGVGLVDAISTAHPSLLEESEIAALGVPTQVCAPETDSRFTPELKAYANETIPKLGIPYDYQYFPGLSHGFATRGDQNNAVEREGLERAKNVAVQWFQQHLH